MAILDTTGGRFARDMDKLKQERSRLSVTPTRAPNVLTRGTTNQVGAAQLVNPRQVQAQQRPAPAPRPAAPAPQPQPAPMLNQRPPQPAPQPVPQQPAVQPLGQQAAAPAPVAPPVLSAGNATSAIDTARQPDPSSAIFSALPVGRPDVTATAPAATSILDIMPGPSDRIPPAAVNPNVEDNPSAFPGADATSAVGSDIRDTLLPDGPQDFPSFEADPAAGSQGDLMDDVINRLMAAEARDTSADEAAAAEAAAAALGQGRVDARAQLGSLGFGSSGALAGIEGGLAQQSQRGLTQDILGIQAGARGEALDQNLAGINAGFRDRELDQEEQQFQMVLDALGDLDDDSSDDGGFSPTNPVDAARGVDERISRDGFNFGTPNDIFQDLYSGAFGGQGADAPAPGSATSTGADRPTFIGTGSDEGGSYRIYDDPDGRRYKVYDEGGRSVEITEGDD